MDRILGGSGMFCRNLQRCTEKRKNGGSIRWSASWRDYDNDDTVVTIEEIRGVKLIVKQNKED